MSYEARLAVIFCCALALMVGLYQTDTEFGVVDAERRKPLPVVGETWALRPRAKFALALDVLESGQRIEGPRLDTILDAQAGYAGTTVYSLFGADSVMASAMGEDLQHYMVHSYLEGYAPFATDSVWEPWYSLANRKIYTLDQDLYGGNRDVWQTSRQAYRRTRGDCEDHAIALADWLIEMGEDARVVIGRHEDAGHAWVVLFKGGKEYLLEATRKSIRREMTSYPLARLETRYRPKFMFNRDSFWANTGSSLTTQYASDAWVEKSHYGWP